MGRLDQIREAVARHPLATDALVAGALAAFVQQDLWGSRGYYSASFWIYVPSALVMTLPLAFRRRASLAVALTVMAALVFEALAVGSAPTPDSQLVAWLLAIYTVAAYSGPAAAAVGGIAGLAAGLVWIGFDDFLFPLVVFGGAWAAGRLVRQRQLYADAVAQRAAALEGEQHANARAAAAEERGRIARELHDLLSHSVSVMVVQAAAERDALGSARAAPAESLEAIERTGRQALAEMRRVFSLLRAGEPAERAPQPNLAELEPLVARIREAGVPVELRVEGEAGDVPDAIALCAYRVVQEALTNVLKHAGAKHASVIVRHAADALELEVADDGRGAGRDSVPGHGLSGMRERVALYGGDFEAAGRNGSGFVVRARIPFASGS